MELVVLVGLPGSGKSTYYFSNYAATHEHVSKDLMKTKSGARQRGLIEKTLRAGRSVVVDNTNATPEIRAELVQIGKALGARLVAVHFDTPVPDCVARNRGREGKGRVPDVAIYAMKWKLKPPTTEEGFDEILVVKG